MGMRGPNAGNGRKKRINRPSVFWMCCFSVVPLRCARIFRSRDTRARLNCDVNAL